MTQPDSTSEIADGGTVTMAAPAIGQPVAASLTFTNQTTTTNTATFNFVQLTGSSDFTISSVPDAPFPVTPRGTFGVQINYQPTTSARTTARLALNYAAGTTVSTIVVNLVGIAPEFSYSYTPQGGNASIVVPGGNITLPATAIDATSNAIVTVTNRGTSQGTIQSIAVSGANFGLVGAPLTGTVVEPGRDIRFTVTYTAKTLDAARGSLGVETSTGRASFNLEASGNGPNFTYQVIREDAASDVRPGQSVPLPDTLINEKSSVVFRIRNTGNIEGRITTISASGTGFTLTEVPLLPLTVPAGGSTAFTINFSPTSPGRAFGRLRVGNDDFDLSGNALGSTLSYAFLINGVSTAVANNGTVIFTPAPVGSNSNLKFLISNTGTAPTSVASIGLSAASTVFSLANLPNLPVSLAPGASTIFDVSFAPAVQGSSTATLKVDTLAFTLSGAGNAPPPLPAYRFEGASGAQGPLQQPAVSLTLASNYPLPLSGALTLAFNSAVGVNDPSVQFSTSGRTVAFTIPANSTRAIFANSSDQVRVQTGSVAGTITLTPSFLTDGGINLTPVAPSSLNLTVAAAAPRVLTLASTLRTANSISLLVSGLATSRSVTQIEISFTAVTGETVGTTRLTIPVESSFLGWYQSAAAVPFGSLFTATVPLTFTGDVTAVTSPSDTIQSVSVTLTNALGTSPAVSLTLH
ncbi:MAG: choice-of-anchor D domain-containing protein [Acidobacteriia bacterium]|nr:choice-of-anchor D domain-containing protein [Terriglobia bacterium]